MIIIGFGALGTIGLLILLVQAICIVWSLIKIVFYLLQAAVYLALIVVCGIGIVIQFILGRLKPEPVLTINFYDDAGSDDASTIELPRKSFHRVRG